VPPLCPGPPGNDGPAPLEREPERDRTLARVAARVGLLDRDARARVAPIHCHGVTPLC